MKVIKYAVLQILFLIAMMLCGAATMKALELLFQLSCENIFSIGFKVGFIAWLGLFILSVFKKKKDDGAKDK